MLFAGNQMWLACVCLIIFFEGFPDGFAYEFGLVSPHAFRLDFPGDFLEHLLWDVDSFLWHLHATPSSPPECPNDFLAVLGYTPTVFAGDSLPSGNRLFWR
jgi:hypothetical protein